MPFYDVAIQIDLTIRADSPTEAHDILTNWQPPHGARIDNIDVIAIKKLAQEDKRIITRLPKLPHDELADAMTYLSPTQITILSLCAQPQNPSILFDCARRIDGTTTVARFTRDLEQLRTKGWLVPVEHDANIKSAPNFQNREQLQRQFSILDRSNTR